MDDLLRFPTEVTADEAAFGFASRVECGSRIALAALDDGLVAVKTRSYDGTIEYVICDASLAPLYTPAKSIDDLRRRFCTTRRSA